MANAVEKLNGIALADIEKINGRTEANIEKINGLSFEAAQYGPPAFVQSVDRNFGAWSSPLTGDITVGTGTGRALIVSMQVRDDDGAIEATSCTFTLSGGSAENFTKLVDVGPAAVTGQLGADPYHAVSIWGLLNPSSGAGEVRGYMNRTANYSTGMKIIELTGVKQDGDIATVLSGTASSATSQSQAIDTTAGQIVIDAISLAGLTATNGAVGASQTQVGDNTTGGKGGSYETAAGTSTTMSWSWDNSSNVLWAIAAIISDVYS